MVVVLYHSEERYINIELGKNRAYHINVCVAAVEEYEVGHLAERLRAITYMKKPAAEHLAHRTVIVSAVSGLNSKGAVIAFFHFSAGPDNH